MTQSFSYLRDVLLLTIFLAQSVHRSMSHGGDISRADNMSSFDQRQLSIEWAQVYPGLTSTTVPLDCHFQGQRTCCSALQGPSESMSDGIPLHLLPKLQRDGVCSTTKEYFPSPYETRHMKKAKEIALVADRAVRHGLLLDFIASPEEVRAAQRWLARVKAHMSTSTGGGSGGSDSGGGAAGAAREHGRASGKRGSEGWNVGGGGGGGDNSVNVLKRLRGHKQRGKSQHQQRHAQDKDENRRRTAATSGSGGSGSGSGRVDWRSGSDASPHPDDEEFLSKFVVTTSCQGGGGGGRWVEWIEPLSVHARHPFGAKTTCFLFASSSHNRRMK